MKIAFHFDADNDSLGVCYGDRVRDALFGIILQSRILNLNTKIFEGDLLLHMHCMDSEETTNGEIWTPNKMLYERALKTLLSPPESHIWKTIDDVGENILRTHNVYVCVFESISFRDAVEIDKGLQKSRWYLGAIQIDDTCPVHWVSYAGSLVCAFRVVGKSINIFWDGYEEDSKNTGIKSDLEANGFKKVEFESLNGKFSIFDKYHDFEQARRVAELNGALSDSLSFLSDQVITRLSDAVPEVGNMLWSIIRAYDEAEVNEQYAQVAASCRRVVEHVADKLFPPQPEQVEGMDVKAPHYKNRLRIYADATRRSDTNIDLIHISTDVLMQQINKLLNLVNKGVHGEVFREEARRCLIRTITILDDIVSLRRDPFKIAEQLPFFDEDECEL